MDIAHARLCRPEQDAVHEFHDRRFNLVRQCVQLVIFNHLEFIDRAVDKVVEIIDVHLSAGIDIIHKAAVIGSFIHRIIFGIQGDLFLFPGLCRLRSTAGFGCNEGLGAGSVIFFDRLNNGAFGCHNSFDIVAGHEFDVVDGEYIGGVDHGDGDRGAGAIDRHDAVFLRYIRGNMFYDNGIDLEFAQVDIRDAVLFAQKRHQLVFLHEPHFDQDRAEPAAFVFLRGKRFLQLIFRDQTR